MLTIHKALMTTFAALALSAVVPMSAQAMPLGATKSIERPDGVVEQARAGRGGGGGGGGGYRGGGAYRGGAAVRGGAVYRGGSAYRGGAAVRGGAVYRGGAVVRGGAVYRGRGGAWARPGRYWWPRGGAIAAGAAIGFVTAATAAAWAGPAPAANMCWYYTDPSRTQGFWDVCP